MSRWLIERAGSALASRTSRRSFIARSAIAGSALAVAPTTYVLRPGTAYAAICGCAGKSCDCASKCCDGYTEFCCTITGENRCPPGTVAAGWWKADAPGLCGDAPRYYVDCNTLPGYPVCSCGCANGNCNNRKACCTRFRYGQCHQEIPNVGAIMCRTVSCTPPWLLDASCTPASATDNATRSHDAACLREAGPETGPGTVRQAAWFFRNSATSGAADFSVSYGDPGDIPVVGDWNGDGVATPGVFRNGWWYLRNQSGGGGADITFPYGDPGDIPIVGKWVGGDNRDLPGVIRGTTWYLKTDFTGGAADIVFSYGDPGDVPIVGDWNGDGVDSPGVFRLGSWYLRNTSSTGVADVAFQYGQPGDIPVPGKWVQGDARDLPAVYRKTGWYIRHDVAGGVADNIFSYGDRGDLPLVGDWDGNGVDSPGVAPLMGVLVLLLGIAVGLLGVLVAGLLRSHAEILRALHELGVNLDDARVPGRLPAARAASATALDIVGTDPDGTAVHLPVGGAPQRTLLAFLTTTCLTCRGFWDDFADPGLEVPANARLVIVTKDADEEQESAIAALAPERVPTVRSSATWEGYGVTVAPYFLLVDPALGVIGEGAATTWPHVRDLLAQAVADRHHNERTVGRDA